MQEPGLVERTVSFEVEEAVLSASLATWDTCMEYTLLMEPALATYSIRTLEIVIYIIITTQVTLIGMDKSPLKRAVNKTLRNVYSHEHG